MYKKSILCIATVWLHATLFPANNQDLASKAHALIKEHSRMLKYYPKLQQVAGIDDAEVVRINKKRISKQRWQMLHICARTFESEIIPLMTASLLHGFIYERSLSFNGDVKARSRNSFIESLVSSTTTSICLAAFIVSGSRPFNNLEIGATTSSPMAAIAFNHASTALTTLTSSRKYPLFYSPWKNQALAVATGGLKISVFCKQVADIDRARQKAHENYKQQARDLLAQAKI